MAVIVPKLASKEQLFLLEQSVGEANVYEDPSANDNVRIDIGSEFISTAELIERAVATGSLSKTAKLVGVKTGQMTFAHEIHGADYPNGELPPADPILKACGWGRGDALALTGVVATDLPFDEVLTGQTSLATVRVLKKTIVGEVRVVIEILTGTPSIGGEIFDGSSTGIAAYTSTAATTDIAGYFYTLKDDDWKRLSARGERAGLVYKMYNSMATMAINGDINGVARLNVTLSGLIHADGEVKQWQVDGPYTVPVKTTTRPGLLNCMNLFYGDYKPTPQGSIALDNGITVTPLPDGNSCEGLEGMYIEDRVALYNYSILTPPQSQLDMIADYFEANEIAQTFTVGKELLNTLVVHIRAATSVDPQPSSEGGNMLQDLTWEPVGENNNEMEMLWI
jgi:hypothetical protein